jgi:hypothetical protein
VRAGSLAAVLGHHESTRGQIAFDVTADHRGMPAVVTPTLTSSGAHFADALGVPYLTGSGGVRALTAADVVDARFIPAAWVAKFGFYGGWLPVMTTAYHGTKPMPYVVAESTAYTYGATVDLVYRLSPTRLLHVETSLFEPQPEIGLQPFGEVVTSVIGDRPGGLTTDQAAVLVATHGSAATVGSRDAAVPLTTELDVPAGVSEPYVGPALSQNKQLASPEVRVVRAGAPQMLRPLVTYTDESRLVVLNKGPGLPVPARAPLPPRSLTPASGLDVVVEGDGVYFLVEPEV